MAVFKQFSQDVSSLVVTVDKIEQAQVLFVQETAGRSSPHGPRQFSI